MMNRCVNCNHHEVSHRPLSPCVGWFAGGDRCTCTEFVEMNAEQQAAANLMDSMMGQKRT